MKAYHRPKIKRALGEWVESTIAASSGGATGETASRLKQEWDAFSKYMNENDHDFLDLNRQAICDRLYAIISVVLLLEEAHYVPEASPAYEVLDTEILPDGSAGHSKGYDYWKGRFETENGVFADMADGMMEMLVYGRESWARPEGVFASMETMKRIIGLQGLLSD